MKRGNNLKNVYFLCYSRYVILVAYILKKTLHENDKVTLIISDGMANEEHLSEYISGTGLWDDVILFHEEGEEPIWVENEVKRFVNTHSIDYFYVAHIMRCASHFFLKYLKHDTEINMFDEGCITLDWISSYNYYTRNGLEAGWVDFDFERVDNIYSFFPSITTAFGKAIVKGIELESIISDQFIDEINLLFNYKYKKETVDILFIDNNGATAGLYSKEYEKYCINNVLGYKNTDNCYIKIKPSENKEVLKEKYGKYNVKFINGGMVPFEVIYLNMIKFGCIPKMIIAVNSAMIWNMAVINQIMNIKLDIVLLVKIMSEYYIDNELADETKFIINRYISSLNVGNDIYIPSTWEELYDIFSERCNLFKETNKDGLLLYEHEWLKSQYMNMLRKEKYIYNPRIYILNKWLDSIYDGKSIADYFRNRGVSKVILYGVGYFGNLFIKAVRGTELTIEFIIQTHVDTSEKMLGDIEIYSLSSYAGIKEQYRYPILITAVGKENEIKKLIVENDIKNEIIMFRDIVDAI